MCSMIQVSMYVLSHTHTNLYMHVVTHHSCCVFVDVVLRNDAAQSVCGLFNKTFHMYE